MSSCPCSKYKTFNPCKSKLNSRYAGCPFDNKDMKFHNFDKCELNEHIEGNKPVETIKKKFIQGPLAYGGVASCFVFFPDATAMTGLIDAASVSMIQRSF